MNQSIRGTLINIDGRELIEPAARSQIRILTPEPRLHRMADWRSTGVLRSKIASQITMACPSCLFARTFASRAAVPSLLAKRTFATTRTALQKSPATPTTQTEQPAIAPLLHITKSKIHHGPSNPNARPPPPSHADITRRLGVRFSRPVPGAQEWRTSTYSYNKATVKTLPTAAQTTNQLLSQYAVLENTGGERSSKSGIAAKRKSAERVYVSKAGIKDFGHKIRIDAYLFDEAKAQRSMLQEKLALRAPRQGGKPGGRETGRGGRAPRAPRGPPRQ